MTALRYYNAQNHADFKLVECLGSFLRVARIHGLRCHTNFRAAEPGVAAENKLFFAELLGPNPKMDQEDQRNVASCQILDGSQFVRGCKMCGKWFAHPEGFQPHP